jgi:hypothetical protein
MAFLSLLHNLKLIFCMYTLEWILLQVYSGLVRYFFLVYQCIYSVVQKELPYFMLKSPPDAVCL